MAGPGLGVCFFIRSQYRSGKLLEYVVREACRCRQVGKEPAMDSDKLQMIEYVALEVTF